MYEINTKERWTVCSENYFVYKNPLLTSLEEPPSATQTCTPLPPPEEQTRIIQCGFYNENPLCSQ